MAQDDPWDAVKESVKKPNAPPDDDAWGAALASGGSEGTHAVPTSKIRPEPGFWSKLYDVTLKYPVEHPGQMIGGAIGGLIAAPAALPQAATGVGTMTGLATEAGGVALGATFGQAAENLIRGKPATEDLMESFLTNLAGMGMGAMATRVAKSLVLRNVPAASRWLTAQSMDAAAKLAQARAAAQARLRVTTQRIKPGAGQSPEGIIVQAKPAAERAIQQNTVELEAARAAGQRKVSGIFSDYDAVINHPDNEAGPGLVLRPGIPKGKPRPGKPITWKVRPVLTTEPMATPVNTGRFATALAQIAETEKVNPLPANNPVKAVLQSLTRFNDKTGRFEINEHIPYETLKQAMGRLGKYVKTDPGEIRNPTQRLATQIRNTVQPIMDEELTKAAVKAGKDPAAAIAARDAGNLAVVKQHQVFDPMPQAKRLAQPGYPAAAAEFPRPAPPTAAVETLKLADSKSGYGALRRMTVGDNAGYHLDAYTSTLPGSERDILRVAVEQMVEKKDWAWWSRMVKNGVADKLTAHDRDLMNVIPAILEELKGIELKYGKAAVPKAIKHANFGPGYTITHPISAIKTKAGEAAVDLVNSEKGRRFLMGLRGFAATQTKRTAVMGTKRTIGQVPISGAVKIKAAMTSPPPSEDKTKLAGEK